MDDSIMTEAACLREELVKGLLPYLLDNSVEDVIKTAASLEKYIINGDG